MEDRWDAIANLGSVAGQETAQPRPRSGTRDYLEDAHRKLRAFLPTTPKWNPLFFECMPWFHSKRVRSLPARAHMAVDLPTIYVAPRGPPWDLAEKCFYWSPRLPYDASMNPM